MTLGAPMPDGKEDKMEDKIVLILAALLAVSEALSLIPSVKANGVFQSIVNVFKSFKK
jgi:hypothetical protein